MCIQKVGCDGSTEVVSHLPDRFGIIPYLFRPPARAWRRQDGFNNPPLFRLQIMTIRQGMELVVGRWIVRIGQCGQILEVVLVSVQIVQPLPGIRVPQEIIDPRINRVLVQLAEFRRRHPVAGSSEDLLAIPVSLSIRAEAARGRGGM